MRTVSLAVFVVLPSSVLLLAVACSAPVSSADSDQKHTEESEDGGVRAGGDGGSSGSTKTEMPARRIGAGADYSCALTSAGVVKCWGRNDKGQLGLGDTQNRGDSSNEMGEKLPGPDLGGGHRAVSIGVGWYHACALLDDGTVKCWGQNDAGQLGQGDTKNRGDNGGEMGQNLAPIPLAPGKKAKAIASGGYHNCALFEDGSVQCWGANAYGQLGLGDTKARGDGADELGANLSFVDLGKGRSAVAIAAGNLHTCAILDNGSLKCWGDGADGQLGLGNANHRGDAPGEMGDSLPIVDLGGAKVVEVATGGFHTCAVASSGALKCWGHNDHGQQGNGDTVKRGDNPGEMGSALPTVNVGNGHTVKHVSALYDHTCAILDDGSVKCWGWNDSGQLGLGDKKSRGSSADSMGDNLPVVKLGTGRTGVQLGIGWDHSCAALDDGSFKCWGLNGSGALGLGDRDTRGDNGGDMGDALPAIEL